jgi:hypothetical protein
MQVCCIHPWASIPNNMTCFLYGYFERNYNICGTIIENFLSISLLTLFKILARQVLNASLSPRKYFPSFFYFALSLRWEFLKYLLTLWKLLLPQVPLICHRQVEQIFLAYHRQTINIFLHRADELAFPNISIIFTKNWSVINILFDKVFKIDMR